MPQSTEDTRKPWTKPTLRRIPLHPALLNHPALDVAAKSRLFKKIAAELTEGMPLRSLEPGLPRMSAKGR